MKRHKLYTLLYPQQALIYCDIQKIVVVHLGIIDDDKKRKIDILLIFFSNLTQSKTSLLLCI